MIYLSQQQSLPRTHRVKRTRSVNFQYTPELLSYMKGKNKRNIAVEVASSDHSDFEVTEIYLRFVSDRMLEELERRRYRIYETDIGKVALPPYVLHYSDTVTFGLKKVLLFHALTYEGIRL